MFLALEKRGTIVPMSGKLFDGGDAVEFAVVDANGGFAIDSKKAHRPAGSFFSIIFFRDTPVL